MLISNFSEINFFPSVMNFSNQLKNLFWVFFFLLDIRSKVNKKNNCGLSKIIN